MNLSAQFKEFLLSQATPPSKVTVKNYASDINKFISWCKKLLGTNFSISDVDSVMLDSYKNVFAPKIFLFLEKRRDRP
jgi:site-specific recombinase XerD